MPTCMHWSLTVLALILLYGGHCFSIEMQQYFDIKDSYRFENIQAFSKTIHIRVFGACLHRVMR